MATATSRLCTSFITMSETTATSVTFESDIKKAKLWPFVHAMIMKEGSGVPLTEQEIVERCIEFHGSVESAFEYLEAIEAQSGATIEKTFPNSWENAPIQVGVSNVLL